MPGSKLKEKMFKCLGQGYKNKENRETYKETKIHTLQNSIISILKLPRQHAWCFNLGHVNTIPPDSFLCWHAKLSGKVWTPIARYVTLHVRDRAAQLRAVAEIAPKSLFFCVNRDSLQYGFRAGAKLSGTERFHGLVFTHVASIY